MASTRTYNHEQVVPSETWNISHRLGTQFPIVDVVVDHEGVKTKILPLDIISVDDNNTQIKFSTPYSGSARLV